MRRKQCGDGACRKFFKGERVMGDKVTNVRAHYRKGKDGKPKLVRAHERKLTSRGKPDGCGGLLLVLMLFLVFVMISRSG